jgi:tetratricopeptide (TPR) repeat protein
MHEEKVRAESLLNKHLQGAPGIVLLALEDPDWVYGQATFAYHGDKPLKFVDRFTTVVSRRILDALTAKGKPSAILFVDAPLKLKFERHAAFAQVKPLFRQVTEFRADPEGGGIFGWIKRCLPRTVEPIPKADEAESCRKGVKVYSERIMREEKLSELLLFLFGLYHYCSLDKAQEVLEARVAAKRNDVVARTGLTLLLSEFGDHDTALAHARTATALPDAPLEAFLWHAKEAWWAEESTEGLKTLTRIRTSPARWPRITRRGVEAVRAALLSQQGDHDAAAQTLENALDIDGSNYALHLCLAHELQAAGRFDDAQAAVENAAVLSPNDPIVQVEICRILEARGETTALQRVLLKLCGSDRGRLEARRFVASEGIKSVKSALPEQFETIDRARHHALVASTLPTWFQLCNASDSSGFTALLNLFLQSDHRGEKEFAQQLSPVFRLLMRNPLDPNVHTSTAALWMLLGRPKIASVWGRSAVALDPDNERAHFVYASALRDAEELDKAFDASELAIVLEKAGDDLKTMYATLLWSIPRLDVMAEWAQTAAGREVLRTHAQGRMDDASLRPAALIGLSFATFRDNANKAIELQKEALRLEPDRDAYHEWHVAMLTELGRMDAAAAALEEQAAALRRREPTYTVETYAQIADVLLELERRDKAYVYVRAGLQIVPDYPELCVAQARVFLQLGRRDAACDELRKVAFSDAALAGKAASLLADALSEAGRREEALEVWKHLQILEPNNAAGFLGAGVDYWILDHDEEAADMVARAVELDASNPYAWGLLGRVLRALGRVDEALPALERALAFERPPKHALLSLARLLISTDRADAALARCTDVLAADPANAEAATGRVEALGATGARDEALRYGLSWLRTSQADVSEVVRMREAIEKWIGLEAALTAGQVGLTKYPDAVDLLVDQAWGMSALGRFSDARALSRKAMQLQPAEVAPLKAYAHACAHLGEFGTDEARVLAKGLVDAESTPYALRLAADVLRAGGADTRPAYEAALHAYAAETSPHHHEIAWCLLHLGRLKEALHHMDSHVALNPEVGSATLDRAIIGFLAFHGAQGWEEKLAEAIRATSRLEEGAGYLAELRVIAAQWSRQALAPSKVLNAMLTVVDAHVRVLPK